MKNQTRQSAQSLCVITDIGCLLELSGINQLDLLKKLYGKIYITPEVAKGYNRKLPKWIEIKKVKDNKQVEELSNTLGAGESSAIILAYETPFSLLILDDKEGLHIALDDFGLTCMGTAGVIRQAFNHGYIESMGKL